MCGIIGMLKLSRKEETIAELVSGLRRLEYRGYDSWGYAFLNGNRIEMEKKTGRIADPTLKGSTGLIVGHSRWATHGGVTEANAHPHIDCKGEIAVVHNGIVENYLELKEELIKKGHVFKSQTDSEVIPHLLEETNGDMYERASLVARRLKGSFAIVIIDKKHPNELIGIKNESPLAIGIADDRVIFASDPLAFLSYTNKAVYMSEGEIAYARKNGNIELKFFDKDGKEIKKAISELHWKSESAELKDYKHYMLKEIFEQPQAMKNGMDYEAAKALAQEMKGKKVVAIACGTARHAAVIGKHVLNRIANYSMDVMMAHEFTYFVENTDKDTVILAVSQSGETADVLECVRKAKKKGIKIISIVNVPSSTLARESEKVYYTNCGPEIAVASTKAFTNQMLAFYLIAYAMAGKEAKGAIEKTIGQLQERLPYFDQKAREIAEYLKNKHDVYMLGRGVNYPVALEGSLKLKEISYIHAEGMPAGELKHGTLALIEKYTPVILLNPNDYTYNDSINNGLETKARGAYVIGISDKAHPSFNIWVELPHIEDEIFYPFFETLPLQLIAYHTAVLLGKDVDRPRNLAKSVTVK
jgi:glucosamine--fructose-6-phosphate aminotransferase (isomerizing)